MLSIVFIKKITIKTFFKSLYSDIETIKGQKFMDKSKRISLYLEEAFALLENFKGTPHSLEERKKSTIDLASLIIKEAELEKTASEKKEQKNLWRMLNDINGKAFTMYLTDQTFRCHSFKRCADQINYLIKLYGIPKYLRFFDQFKLYLFKNFSSFLPFIFIPLLRFSIRSQTKKVILAAEKKPLFKHLHKRKAENVTLNINYLGESILSEVEAQKRLLLNIEYLSNPDIHYVSVKISTLFSQINLLAWDHSKQMIAEKLREIYRAAIKNSYIDSDGKKRDKFVNLDMEEYKDLHLTVEVFQMVLDEPEFYNYHAGIVLQAYLPDSFNIQKELTEWAKKRVKNGGAPIKLRLVKGANLSYEQVTSSIKEWPQPPFTSKVEVDANFKRMLLYACIPENIQAIHLGIGSHNIFEISFALLLIKEREIESYASFEMLEGITDQVRRVVQKLAGTIILYCPITKKKDFQHAIAYLLRRLDENSGKENFLHHSFKLKAGSPDWEGQVSIFSHSCDEIEKISTLPRRTQNRLAPPPINPYSPFENEPDTDFSLEENRKWGQNIIQTGESKSYTPIPLVINNQEILSNQEGIGIDPSKNTTLFRYALADDALINQAITCAKQSEEGWAKVNLHEKSLLLSKVAQKFREKRDVLIGSMIANGGKTIPEADPEVSEAIDFLEYYRRQMEKMNETPDLSFKPKGTILVTPPWNFPCSIPTGGIAAALITGNCVIFKPAPEAVLIGWELVNLFWEGGISKDVLQFINCIDDPIGTNLIKDKRINCIILTGGTATAKFFIKTNPDVDLHAETGGKNAMIISAMADKELAIQHLLKSAFGHSGQKCSAASLAILEKEVYDDKKFLAQLKNAALSIHVGSSWALETDTGPLIHPPEGPLLKGLTSLEKGQSYLLKPQQDPHNPNLWTPGIILGVRPNSFIQKTELFGPVLGLIRAENFDDALSIANNTQYGLTSGLQSLDQREHIRWIEKIEAGNCYINRSMTGAIIQRQPFGGCKNSSFGSGSKAGGANYLRQLVHIEQKKLPKEKSPISKEVNDLTTFLSQLDLSAEELGTWYGSIANYAYWWQRLKKNQDVSKIVGEDNFFCYVPRTGMILRIDQSSTLLDSLRSLAAALTCFCPLEISYEKREGIDFSEIFSYFRVIEEDDEGFNKRISSGLITRARLMTKASSETKISASKEGVHIIDCPVLINGRYELLHYLREVSLSIDYHRHGNLGIREEELRKPIL